MISNSASPPDGRLPAPETTPGTAMPRMSLWRVILVSSLATITFAVLRPKDLSAGWQSVGWGVSLHGTALLWWLVTAWRRQHSLRAVMGEGLGRKDAMLVLATTLAAVGTHIGWLAIAYLLGLHTDSTGFEWLEGGGDAALRLATFLVVAVLAPCVEEVLFRGLIFRRLLSYAHPRTAAMISSVLFGMLHFDMIGATLTGMLFVVLYARVRSLWAPILAHMLNNALALLLVWQDASRGLTVSVGALACLALGLPWLLWFVYRGLKDIDAFPRTV